MVLKLMMFHDRDARKIHFMIVAPVSAFKSAEADRDDDFASQRTENEKPPSHSLSRSASYVKGRHSVSELVIPRAPRTRISSAVSAEIQILFQIVVVVHVKVTMIVHRTHDREGPRTLEMLCKTVVHAGDSLQNGRWMQNFFLLFAIAPVPTV